MEKSQTNANNAIMHVLTQVIWGNIWKLTHCGEKSNKCKQCKYASSYPSALRRHLKTHSGEKLNKCSQCEYASSQAGHLKAHLKTHSGKKSNKCNQCDYASSQAGDLRKHLKTHSGEKSNKCDFQSLRSWTNATNVTLYSQRQAIWGNIWKRTMEKSQTRRTFKYWESWVNESNVTLYSQM